MQPTDPHETPTVADEMLGRVVDGRYRVERVLGEGGLGRVYVARNLRLDREVALKVLLAQHAATPTLRARFEREAKTLSALSHPNIVTVTDFGLDGEEAFVVMELVQGDNLAELIADTPPPPEVAIGIMRSVLSALAYAHEQGVVHRDLKPSNVLVRELPDGTHHVEVLDFGLAKFLDDDDTESSASALTKSGVMLGTPAYMSPEQACGDAVDARSDVYSAGLLLYELVVGQRPMPEHTGPQLLKRG